MATATDVSKAELPKEMLGWLNTLQTMPAKEIHLEAMRVLTEGLNDFLISFYHNTQVKPGVEPTVLRDVHAANIYSKLKAYLPPIMPEVDS
jgi:hypothetical protein